MPTKASKAQTQSPRERRSDSMTSDSGSSASNDCHCCDSLSTRLATDNRRFVRRTRRTASRPRRHPTSAPNPAPPSPHPTAHRPNPRSGRPPAAPGGGGKGGEGRERVGRRRRGCGGLSRGRRGPRRTGGPAVRLRMLASSASALLLFCRPLDKLSPFTIAWAGPFSSTSVLPLHLS